MSCFAAGRGDMEPHAEPHIDGVEVIAVSEHAG